VQGYGVDYWGALMAAHAVMEPVEASLHGVPLLFRDAFQGSGPTGG